MQIADKKLMVAASLLLFRKTYAWLFCQANMVAGNVLWQKKQEICKHLCYPKIIIAVWWTVFLKLLFQSYKYQ